MTNDFLKLFEIIESVNAIIWEYNIVDDSWDYVSPQTKTMLGYEPEDWTDLDFWAKNMHPEDRNWALNYCLSCTKKGEEHIFEYRFMKKTGGYIWIRDEVVVIMEEGEPIKLRGFMTDISELKEREEEIKFLLYKDQLTGIYNRRYFEEEIERLDSKRKLPISIIMADINGLKLVNDTFGHKEGDQLLIKTANLLKESLREEDIIARYGGDEFVILIPETSKDQAWQIFERLKKNTEETTFKDIPLSISFGIAVKSEEGKNIEEVLIEADNAMYQNKLLQKKSSKSKIIDSLLNTLSFKSKETREHGIRMKNLASKLAEEIDLSRPEIDRLELLAVLHDIGEVTISRNILMKEGVLTEQEWEIVKEHTETGSRIASSINEFAFISKEILFHHERWDGKGYPKKLREKEIPLLSRIISIVDAYDVMTHDRPYSEAISKEEALEEIRKCAGSQFDPELAFKFIEIIKD